MRASAVRACIMAIVFFTAPLGAILEELEAIRQELVATASRLSAEQWEQRVLFPWGNEGPVAKMLDELLQRRL